jgi:hypothetical protein
MCITTTYAYPTAIQTDKREVSTPANHYKKRYCDPTNTTVQVVLFDDAASASAAGSAKEAGNPWPFHLVFCGPPRPCACISSLPPPSPPSRSNARCINLTSAVRFSLLSFGGIVVSSERTQSLAPTNLAHASVLKDLGLSIGAPTARSMMSCGSTPSARLTPKSTV